MMAKRILYAAISVATLVFCISQAAMGQYWMAGLALLIGAGWLVLEIHDRSPFPSLFFIAFLGLTVLALVHQISPFISLLGWTASLAAWDLSRFLQRTRQAPEATVTADLYQKHLYRLSITLGAGFLLAVLPLFFRITVRFIVLAGLILLTMIVLRRSILSLWSQEQR